MLLQLDPLIKQGRVLPVFFHQRGRGVQGLLFNRTKCARGMMSVYIYIGYIGCVWPKPSFGILLMNSVAPLQAFETQQLMEAHCLWRYVTLGLGYA
jgi:hypothetical protein